MTTTLHDEETQEITMDTENEGVVDTSVTDSDNIADAVDSDTTAENGEALSAETAKDQKAEMKRREADARRKAANKVISSLNTRYKKKQIDNSVPVIGRVKDRPIVLDTLSTGSIVGDYVLGGGLAKGRIIEIYGPEASGKTSIALVAAAQVQRSGGQVVFFDLEYALNAKYAASLGVNFDELTVCQPDTAEVAFDMMRDIIDSNAFDLIIVDSVPSLIPAKRLEKSAEDATISILAKLMSEQLSILAAKTSKSQTTIIFLNQTREKVGVMYGNPETTSGGKALPFYASQRLRVGRKAVVKRDGKNIGTTVVFKCIKNKIGEPFRVAETTLTFTTGISREDEIAEVGERFGIVERVGNSRTYVRKSTGEVITKVSRGDIAKVLREDRDLFEGLVSDLKVALESGADGGAEEEPTDRDDDHEVDDD